jgi:hypothetical protein
MLKMMGPRGFHDTLVAPIKIAPQYSWVQLEVEKELPYFLVVSKLFILLMKTILKNLIKF